MQQGLTHASAHAGEALAAMEIEIESLLVTKVEEMKQARSQKRREILAKQAPAQKGQRVKFSKHSLVLSYATGYPRLKWVRFIYRKGQSKPSLADLPMKDGTVHMSRVISGAHPDEVELLKSQELEARWLRELIVRNTALRRAYRQFEVWRHQQDMIDQAPVEHGVDE